ncbi:MAG TPA: transglycosylase SLT domain-containing protein, partial [Thermoanaerobaculia bacterium]|nr:transglycosylase SLT domain-containing protein [Thermoanaerobaculia bacterium]
MSAHRPGRGRLAAWIGAALLAVAAAARGDDPRVELVERQIAGDHAGALAATEALLAQPPAGIAASDLAYVRGRLLARLGRPAPAAAAFARVLAPGSDLAPYARLRLAELQDRMGHPEVAAGLAATLLGSQPPASLAPAATRLLRSTLAAGGDCRLLGGLDLRGLPARERRQLELALADCELRAGREDAAVARLLELLEENLADAAALDAADRIAALATAPADGRVEHFLGLALHSHREFDRAAHHLEQALAGLSESRGDEAYELRYALLRGHFWKGRYRAAATGFGALARQAGEPRRVADALYQEGRSLELLGDWNAAAAAFRRAFLAHPRGEDAHLALFAALRLEWRSGRETAALDAYRALGARPAYRAGAARAALFLAASDLVRGRHDRAQPWLAEADAHGAAREESAYWRGRLNELQGRAASAVLAYVEVLRADPHHPLARAARQRLAAPPLAGPARAIGLRLARGATRRDLHAAWLLLGDDHPAGRASREALATLLRADRRAGPFLTLEEVPPARWPILARPLGGAEERLLGLGEIVDGAPAVLAHFPVSEPRLAYTGAQLLARAGETRRSLLIAEILGERGAESAPAPLLPAGYRRLLYPLPYREELRAQAARQAVDPHLLAAVLREESRFDPQALSAAAARGLAQFVLPTARRLAAQLGLADFAAADLDQPATAIALAAAYLRELDQLFPAAPHMAIAAYNAGEPQAVLWRSYCYSSEPEEYLTKVAFRETRGYLT